MEPRRELIGQLRATILTHGMILPEDRIIVAVSGGPDSVCLLHLLHRLSSEFSASLVVAHFDHGLRPGEDESETALVRTLAADLGLAFETERSRVALGTGGSREERAREARYDFLERVRAARGAHKIAVAHTLDDQAETFLLRLLRGSGSSGLSAIPPVRDARIIRPLIEVRRSEIENYLKERGLPSATDSSNAETTFHRNRIRLELMPLLLQYQPKLIEHLGETAAHLREESEFLDALAAEWMGKEAEVAPKGVMTIPCAPFLALPAAMRRRVTRRIFRTVKGDIRRIGRVHIRAVEDLARSEKPQATLDLPGPLTIARVYDHLSFSLGAEQMTPDFSYPVQGPGTLHLTEINRTLTLIERESTGGPTETTAPETALLDADKIRFPLVVRNFRPGDRFIPLGMRGHKKLKDFFVDLKVPLSQRRSTPLLCRDDAILWVCGFRIDERFKVTSGTGTVLEARLE